jgi:hypothetical protein
VPQTVSLEALLIAFAIIMEALQEAPVKTMAVVPMVV